MSKLVLVSFLAAGGAALAVMGASRPGSRDAPDPPPRPAVDAGVAAAHSSHKRASLPETAPRAGGCADLYAAGDFALLSAYDAPTAIPELARPQKGVGVREPTFGTCLVRATDRQADYPNGGFLRNDYSRRQAFNADDSRYLAFSTDGYWHLYDAANFKHLGVLKGLAGDAEPQWQPNDPQRLDYLPLNGGTVIDQIDIRRGASKVVADLKAALPAWGATAEHIWTKSEGSPSADGRYWGFQVENGKFELLGFLVWDQQNQRVVGAREGSERPDHVSMTPSGRWFTISDDDTGTWAWSPDFTQKKKLHHKSEHSDLAIGADGHDVYVSIDYQSNGGDVFYADVDACPAVPADVRDAPVCPRTVLFRSYVNGSVGAMHFSGKAYDRPGWVLVSTYGTTPQRNGALPWFADKIFALELKDKPRALGIAYHRSIGVTGLGYWSEPQATVDRGFRRIQFSSSWQSTNEGDIEAYQVLLPDGVLDE
ncbi:hypothetical protein [Dokdonella sp.]|uniref:hypothetical protein n=1 Tax=Dokdonella sp. TaxID=2291710 RepID=UPI001B0441C6|nr:hypothetical protein [Dokdonella sp.]MBO9661978.1 hypothetical protein [Dokdonella sp.]